MMLLKKEWRLIVCAVILVFAFAGITAAASFGAAGNMIPLTIKDNGKKIMITPGDTITVKLKYTAGTGYTWEIEKIDKEMLSLVKEPEFFPADKNLMGGTGYEVFTFKALSTGATVLKIKYLRTWEKSIAPVETFGITFDIVGSGPDVSYFLAGKVIEGNKEAEHYSLKAMYPEIEKYKDKNAQDSCNKIIKANVEESILGFKESLEKGNIDKAKPMSFFLDYDPRYRSNDYLNLIFNGIIEDGEAKPEIIIYSMLLDLAKGKEMALKDIFKPDADYLNVISVYCRSTLEKMGDAEKIWIKKGTAPEEANFDVFFLTDRGITIVFPPSRAESVDSGVTTVPVPYETLKDILNPDWKAYPPSLATPPAVSPLPKEGAKPAK